MNLSPEVAHLLRQALNEAELIRYRDYDADGAFQILSEAVGNLLPPLPVAPAPAVPTASKYDERDSTPF